MYQTAEFKVHRAQSEVLQSASRYQVVISGRRFGKSTLQLVKLYREWTTPRDRSKGKIRPTVLGLAPTHPQARSILFNPFLDFLYQIWSPSAVASVKINRTLMTLDLGDNYPLLRFSGAHGTSQERLRGLKLSHCGVDESQDISMQFLQKVIFPALADTGGSALFTGTPKSKADVLYQLSHGAAGQDTQSFNYSSYCNTLIPGFHAELDKLRSMLPKDVFEQEILAQFVNKSGAFYTEFDRSLVLSQAQSQLPLITDWMVGFDPGALNRGWVIVGRHMEQNVQNFLVVHAQLESQHSLDSEALVKVQQQILQLNRNLVKLSSTDHRQKQQAEPKLRMVAIDPSRPELVVELRQNKVNALKAENAFESGINVGNTLMVQKRIRFLDRSLLDGSSLDWFIDQVEGYHRKTDPNGVVLDREDDDIPTHTLDGFRYLWSTLNKHSKDLLQVSSIIPTRKGYTVG